MPMSIFSMPYRLKVGSDNLSWASGQAIIKQKTLLKGFLLYIKLAFIPTLRRVQKC